MRIKRFQLAVTTALLIGLSSPVPSGAQVVQCPSIDRMLACLPPGTETITVLNGPFVVSANDKRSSNFTEQLERSLCIPLGLGLEGASGWVKILKGRTVLRSAMGTQNFEQPHQLGTNLYDGIVICVFKDSIRDLLPRLAKGEKDSFVALANDNTLVIETAKSEQSKLLQGTLYRIKTSSGECPLPGNLPEWKYIWRDQGYWAIRHYQKQTKDPASPYFEHDKHTTDQKAVGVTFQYVPRRDPNYVIMNCLTDASYTEIVKQKEGMKQNLDATNGLAWNLSFGRPLNTPNKPDQAWTITAETTGLRIYVDVRSPLNFMPLMNKVDWMLGHAIWL